MSPGLVLKDPYVLNFLGLQDRYLEKDMEDAILREMEAFLLELGDGFAFLARQKRIQIDNDDTTWKVIRGGKLEEDKDRDFGFI